MCEHVYENASAVQMAKDAGIEIGTKIEKLVDHYNREIRNAVVTAIGADVSTPKDTNVYSVVLEYPEGRDKYETRVRLVNLIDQLKKQGNNQEEETEYAVLLEGTPLRVGDFVVPVSGYYGAKLGIGQVFQAQEVTDRIPLVGKTNVHVNDGGDAWYVSLYDLRRATPEEIAYAGFAASSEQETKPERKFERFRSFNPIVSDLMDGYASDVKLRNGEIKRIIGIIKTGGPDFQYKVLFDGDDEHYEWYNSDGTYWSTSPSSFDILRFRRSTGPSMPEDSFRAEVDEVIEDLIKETREIEQDRRDLYSYSRFVDFSKVG